MEPAGGEPRTLASDLRERDDDALVALLRARPDLAAPLPPDLAGLAARASTRTSVLRATDRLDAAGWYVLQALLVLHEPASYGELRALLGTPSDAELRPVLDRLRLLALAWGPDRALRVPPSLRELGGEYPAGLGPPALRLLLAQPYDRVASIASTLGLVVTGEHSTDARAVAAVLASDADVARLLTEVDEAAQHALRQMTWGPPVGRVADARRPLGPPEAHSTIDQLLARGLVVAAGGDRVLMPREIGLHLRGGSVTESASLTPPALDTVPRDAALVDRTAAGAAAAFVGHVSALLDRWGLAPPTELRAGGLTVRDVRAAAAALALDETDAALVAEVAHAAGLVASSGDVELMWMPTPEYDRWHACDLSQQWSQLAVAWLTSNRVAGLAGTRDDRDRRLAPLGPDLTRASVSSVRLDVLSTLATTSPGAAPPLQSLLDAVTWLAPRRAGHLQQALVAWTVREAAQLGITGMGAIASYGRALLTEAVAPGSPAVTAVRSPASRAAANAPPAAQSAAAMSAAAALAPLLPEPVDYVLLQADMTAIAPGPLVPELAESLAMAAEVESTGGATVYRFTTDSLRRAFDAGRSVEDVHRLLTEASRTPVPQPLHYLVDDVARRHGRVRVSSVKSVVRVDDEAAADQLISDRSLAGLGLRRLAATVLSSEQTAQAVVDLMRESGHSPVVEGPGGELLMRRPKVRRAPASRRPRRSRSELTVAAPGVLDAAVRTLRAGDRMAAAHLFSVGAGARTRPPLVARRPVDTIAMLTDALVAGQSVWIGYVDNNGSASERLVDPIRVEGGWLTAYDHLRDDVRTFAAHRITGVAVVADPDDPPRAEERRRTEEHSAP